MRIDSCPTYIECETREFDRLILGPPERPAIARQCASQPISAACILG